VDRIFLGPALDSKIFEQALGTPETWCTYFEKAELAEQSGQWDEVRGLLDEAQKRGFSPSHGAEYLPFLRAALALRDYARALPLTEAAARLTTTQAMRQTLCLAWQHAPGALPELNVDLDPPLSCQP
jgi:hypothetical protein